MTRPTSAAAAANAASATASGRMARWVIATSSAVLPMSTVPWVAWGYRRARARVAAENAVRLAPGRNRICA